MVTIRWTWSGVSEVASFFSGLLPKEQSALDGSVDDVKKSFQASTPVETGNLRDSVNVVPSTKGWTYSNAAERPGRTHSGPAIYAAYVEFGTCRTKAHHFVSENLIPAAEVSMKAFASIFS